MTHTVAREPRRDRQFWMDHIQRWKDSGLSKAAYCQQQHLKPGSFYNWSSRLLSNNTDEIRQPPDLTPTLPDFLPVKITSSASPSVSPGGQFVHVQRAATEVALPSELSAEQIQHWLDAIHRLHV